MADLRCLQHLFSSGERYPANRVFAVDSCAIINIHLAGCDVGHGSESAFVFEIETWADVGEEVVGGTEVLMMIEVGAHEISTIVVIGCSVLVGVGLVEGDADTFRLVVAGGKRITLILMDAASTKKMAGIVVGIIFPCLEHGFSHFVGGEGEHGQGVAIEVVTGQEDVAGVGYDVVGDTAHDTVFHREAYIGEGVKLKHGVARDIRTCFGIFHMSEVGRGVARQHGIDFHRPTGYGESSSRDGDVVFLDERLAYLVCGVIAARQENDGESGDEEFSKVHVLSVSNAGVRWGDYFFAVEI